MLKYSEASKSLPNLIFTVVPSSVAPGAELKVHVRAQGAFSDADFVQISVDGVGKLRGNAYAMWTIPKIADGEFAGLYRIPATHSETLLEIQALRFSKQNAISLDARPGTDYARVFFEVKARPTNLSQAELVARAENLMRAREAEFISGWGVSSPTNKTFNVFAFYRNCFARGGDLVLRKARVMGLEGTGADEVLDLIERFFGTRTRLTGVTFTDRQELNQRFKRDNPWIAFYFPNVRAEGVNAAFGIAQPQAEMLSLLMSFDTGSAPEFVGAGLFDVDGSGNWVFAHKGYRGNLVAPFGPGDYALDHQFETLQDRPDLRLYLSLHRDATAEQNPDVQYFRYWTLLEAMARGQGRHSGERGVRDLLEEHERQFNVNFGITVNKEHFSTQRCIAVWAARRHITAHFGGFNPSDKRQQLERKSFETAFSALAEIRTMQHDFYLDQLKEASRVVIGGALVKRDWETN